MNELLRIWADQADFNRHFRNVDDMTPEQRLDETKEMVLHLFSECDELLRASGAWKRHRRVDTRENRRAVGLELADAFKYLMTIAQIQGFTAEDLVDLYWEKSMVVRQRYSQEFVNSNLDAPAVVVDIDNVLADYISGFVAWLVEQRIYTPEWASEWLSQRRYISAESLGMSDDMYRNIQHEFRVSGEHARLPIMPGALDYLYAVMESKTAIILLTARPIDRYPNLYSETLVWLQLYGIPFTWVWWARDKGDAIRGVDPTPYIQYAVDDEWKYVEQYARVGQRVYWLNHGREIDPVQNMKLDRYAQITVIQSLDQIAEEEKKHNERIRNTQLSGRRSSPPCEA